MFVVVCVLIGIGFGGVMLNLIVLLFEVVELCLCSSVVVMMYCGILFGGVIVLLIGVLFVGDIEWCYIFYVGGLGLLLFVLLFVWCLLELCVYFDVVGM